MKGRLIFAVVLCATAAAQETDRDPELSPATYLMSLSSGTSLNPLAWPMPMMMQRKGSWTLMYMGQAFLVDTQQSGPRGGDKLYSTNWGMASAQHSLGNGKIMFDAMLSLEPATVTNRSYPLLFQTGETAYGRFLTDAQHPHDFVMGLGAHYVRPVGEYTLLHFYYAGVGDPALGPVAFPHRASAFELPQAPIGHHWEDSTHIASNVATVGVKYRWIRLEASGFHGAEPNENRWNIDWGGMDSYSGRVSVFPSKNWTAQFSAGRLTKPEPLEAGDVVRTTASIHYTRARPSGEAWSTSAIWGRNHKTATNRDTNAWLLETLFPATGKDFITGRFEVADKDELFPDQLDAFRIKAITAGYTRDLTTKSNLETGIGANVTGYVIPTAIRPAYGDHPWGLTVYFRVRLKRS
ncbi:MAG: hypothetical protein JWO19_800 [Bryobacterales bacterium]|nr:hypothetical protein [Bryobacterales bacterium]